MATMKWIKPSRATIAYFERLAPGPPLETRRMFGMPCRFLNGHLLVGIFQNSLMVHLDRTDRARCIRAGAKPFKPMGREMKEYVEIKPGTFEDREFKEWIVRGMRYLASLPPNGTRNVAPVRRSTKPKPKKPTPRPSRRPAKKQPPRRKATKAAVTRRTKPKAARKKAKRSPKKRTASKR